MITVESKYKTPNGKEVGIRNSGGTSLYEAYLTSGGEIAKMLKGKFTSPTKCGKHIEHYLANQTFRKPSKSSSKVTGETLCQST